MRCVCWFNTTAVSEYCRRMFSLRSSEYLCFCHEIDLVYRRAERTQVTYMFHRWRKLGVRQSVLGRPIKSPPILSASTVGIVSKKLSVDRWYNSEIKIMICLPENWSRNILILSRHIFLFPLGCMARSHFLYTSNNKEREKRSRNSFVKTNVRGNQI